MTAKKKVTHIIDLDADPRVRNWRWGVWEHTKGGQLEFDPTKIALYLVEEQKKGKIVGNNLLEKLRGMTVYNDNLLEFFLHHPHLVPEEWRGKNIFFWGTIFTMIGKPFVHCLVCESCGDLWSLHGYLDDPFGPNDHAIVLASS